MRISKIEQYRLAIALLAKDDNIDEAMELMGKVEQAFWLGGLTFGLVVGIVLNLAIGLWLLKDYCW